MPRPGMHGSTHQDTSQLRHTHVPERVAGVQQRYAVGVERAALHDKGDIRRGGAVYVSLAQHHVARGVGRRAGGGRVAVQGVWRRVCWGLAPVSQPIWWVSPGEPSMPLHTPPSQKALKLSPFEAALKLAPAGQRSHLAPAQAPRARCLAAPPVANEAAGAR